MTTLNNLLRERKKAIVGRWLDSILSSYPGETPAFLRRSRDPFANPVGHALRTGTEGIYESLIGKADPERTCRHLEEIIRIRAVQDLTPSKAVSFVFLLKDAVRAELEETTEGLAEFEAKIDQAALFAFDIYVRYRDRVGEIRINEIKRSVANVMERFKKNGAAALRGGER